MPKSSLADIQSISRAMRILHAFGLDTPELSVGEISRLLGTHTSTASRIAGTLASSGMLQKNPETGRYQLGIGVVALAGMVVVHSDLREVARPHMRELRDLTRETVNLTCLVGDEAINVEQVTSPHAVMHVGWIGRKNPLHCTAAGRSILAHLPESRIAEIIASGPPAFTPNTITDPGLLQQELKLIRERRYTTSVEEFEAGLSAVGAPIFDHRGQVESSLCVSGPAFRLTAQRLADIGEMVRHKAAEISHAIGYSAAAKVPTPRATHTESRGRTP